MSTTTSIEWTDTTWNPVRGCSRVSEGCRNCYAEKVAHRFSGPGQPYEGLTRDGKWTGEVRVVEKHLRDPLRWKRPRRIFVNSMSDLFHESLPDEVIDRVFAVMALSPQHTFQVLTKRPERMQKYLSMRMGSVAGGWDRQDKIDIAASAFSKPLEWSADQIDNIMEWPLPNVWLGVSVEDQESANQRIPTLLRTPAAVRFLSVEPLLGPVDLGLHGTLPGADHGGAYFSTRDLLHWVIVGGESGPDARPMNPEWVRSLRDQCVEAGVPFFFKQWGGRDKKAAGRELDGRTWDEMPEAVS